MTLSNRMQSNLLQTERVEAPYTLKFTEISIVIPVRDNFNGIKKLLKYLCKNRYKFLEAIIVDDGSKEPLSYEGLGLKQNNFVKIIRVEGLGPASARNKGVELSKGDWILFIDSDCLITDTLFDIYQNNINGSIGYAGYIKAYQDGILSNYYDSQRILLSFSKDESNSPQYLVTSNALIWKKAFKIIGGFDESFPLAAGEDVDLGFRLLQIGQLKYIPNAIIIHDFGGLLTFFKRFFRYGRANAMLEKKYLTSFLPKKQKVNKPRIIFYFLAKLQYVATTSGYLFEKRRIKYLTNKQL